MTKQQLLTLSPVLIHHYRAGIWEENQVETKDKSITTSGMICDTRIQT